MSSGKAEVLRSEPLGDSDAKWVGLRAIYWKDPDGKERKWESADRRTRKGDVDAVAICAVINRPSSEPHLLLVSQFRPPVNASVVEMPAGLVDEGEEGDEGAQRAAMRELEEETGYGTDKEGGKTDVQLVTDIMVNDPGMSGANMKLCVVSIDLADDAPEPVAKPDEGEFIEKHLVPVKGLIKTLQDFRKKGFHVDARLAHMAVGIELGLGKLGSSKIANNIAHHELATELIQWVNDLLLLNYTKIEQLGAGAAYCQIIDSIYGNVPLAKVNFAARQEYEYLSNFKVLQETFKRNKVDKPIPVERLVKCKMQDNLEFTQWIRKFWDQNYPGHEYDPEARRAGRGVAPPPIHGATARNVGAGPTAGHGVAGTATRRTAAAPTPAAARARPAAAAAPAARVGRAPAQIAQKAAPQVVPDETIQALTAQMDEMKVSVDSLERERDFYFNKLRDIELMVQDRLALLQPAEGEEPIDEGGPEEVLLKQIQAVLYSTEEGFEVPEGQEPPLDEEEVF